jgi:hypothetical protein
MKQGSLLCFVCHAETSQTMALHVAFLISSESSWWVEVHQFGLRLFEATMWKLLIIEPFFQSKSNRIETENCIGTWGCSWCYWKALGKSDLIKFISQFSKLRCWKILISNWILLLEIQTNYRNWVWKEKSV